MRRSETAVSVAAVSDRRTIDQNFRAGWSRPHCCVISSMPFSADEAFAVQLDATDPLRRFRDEFFFPKTEEGEARIYLAGNSLGLMPKAARGLVEQELSDWAELGVD